MEWLQLLCCTSNSKGLIYMRWGEVLINMSAIWFERGKNTKVQYRFSRRMKVERIFAFLENVVLKCNANTLLCFSQNWNLHYRLCKKHARKMGKMFNFLQDSLSRQFCLTASGEDFHTLTSRHNVFIKKKKSILNRTLADQQHLTTKPTHTVTWLLLLTVHSSLKPPNTSNKWGLILGNVPSPSSAWS